MPIQTNRYKQFYDWGDPRQTEKREIKYFFVGFVIFCLQLSLNIQLWRDWCRLRFGRDKAPILWNKFRAAILAQDIPDFHGDGVIDAYSRYMLFSTIITISCVSNILRFSMLSACVINLLGRCMLANHF